MNDLSKTLLKLGLGAGLFIGGTVLGSLGTKKIKEGAEEVIDFSSQLFKGIGQNNAPQQIASGCTETVETIANGAQQFAETTEGIAPSGKIL